MKRIIVLAIIGIALAGALAFGLLHPAHACSVMGGNMPPCHA